ncbi:hypothetical protein [Streptomyces cinereoruber]
MSRPGPRPRKQSTETIARYGRVDLLCLLCLLCIDEPGRPGPDALDTG